jgi:excinuclease UvrABC ATPase subunit
VIAEGTPAQVKAVAASITGRFLAGTESIDGAADPARRQGRHRADAAPASTT